MRRAVQPRGIEMMTRRTAALVVAASLAALAPIPTLAQKAEETASQFKETKAGDGVSLTVEGIGPDGKKTTGTVEILKEGGAWKVGNESWQSPA
jgi:hypothetical protein